MLSLKRLMLCSMAITLVGISSVQLNAANRMYNLHRAAEVDFAGTVGYGMEAVSGYEECTESGGISRIYWEIGEDGPYNMWFRVNGVKQLTSYLDELTIESGTEVNNTYKLYAGREHIIDPEVYIKGTWEV